MKAKAMIGGVLLAAAGAGAWVWHSYDPRYYPAAELKHAAYPLKNVYVDPMPMVDGIEYFGKIRFDVYIGAGGQVDRIEMLESTMPAKVRDEVVNAFREAKWQAARLADGREVRSVKRVEVTYEIPPGAARRPMAPDS